MSKRKSDEIIDLEETSFDENSLGNEGSERFSTDQKIAIIQACLKHPKKLFEKFDHEINRETQQEAWNAVISDLASSGIFVSDTKYLRKRVTNWIQRATARSDRMKMTGIGKQKPLGEFNELCLSFVKEAKGNSAVDYISSVPEPGGSNEGSSSIKTTVNSQPPLQDPTVPRPKKQKKK